jgi:prophage regulatory protein
MQTNIQIEPLLDADAVAAALNVSTQTLRRYWRAGAFPAPLRMGRRSLRWRLSDIETWINSKGKNHDDNGRTTESGNGSDLPNRSTSPAASRRLDGTCA